MPEQMQADAPSAGPMEAIKMIAEGMSKLKGFVPPEGQEQFLAVGQQVKEFCEGLMGEEPSGQGQKQMASGMSPEASANPNARPVV